MAVLFKPTYLYVKTHNKTGLKYFGKTVSANPYSYRGSGVYWKRHIKQHGYDVTTEIIGYFTDKRECMQAAWEFSVHHNITLSEEWANLRDECLDGGDTMNNRIGAKCSKTGKHLGAISKMDPRWAVGEIVPVNVGYVTVTDLITNKNKRIPLTEFDASQHVSTIKNRTPARIVSTGENILAHMDDPRWATGELVSNSAGKAAASDNNGISLGLVDLSDPRWKTGEILSSVIGINVGTTPAKCNKTGTSLGRVSNDDPRWAVGEIVALSKGRYKDCSSAKDATTGAALGMILKSDPRWKTGQIVGIKKKL